jgi:4-amino-4-deoxy-L-arabinose transferase-like glycosyltransferase
MIPDNDQTGPTTLTDDRKPKYTKLWVLLILLLGLGLRVAGLVWGQAFCYDSQGDCLDAYRVAVSYVQGEPQAQYIGQPNFMGHAKLPGPLWAMFCAAGLHLWGSIDGVVWAIILLNTAAIYLTYLLAARTVGFPAALWAALLMATSPTAIEFSVVVFNPVVMSFLGACLFLALWQVVQQDRSRAAFWLLFLPLMMLQFHMSGLMLIPAMILVLWLKPARLNVPWLVGGIVAGLVLYLPYVFGEMAHGWENTRGMTSGEHLGYSIEAFKIFSAPPGFLVNYWDPRWTFRPDEYQEIGRACFGSFSLLLAFNVLSVILAVSLAVGAFGEVRAALRGFWRSPRAAFARSPGMVFLTIIFTVPLMTSLVEGRRFHGRYCLVLLAPLFSLAAVATVRWLYRQRIRQIFLPLLLAILGANIWLVLTVFRYQGRCIEQGALFLPSFHNLETVYQTLKAHAGKNQLIQVEDGEYMQAITPKHGPSSYPHQICQYVAIRECENSLLSAIQPPVSIYKIVPANQVRLDNPAIAYREHGIALVAVPAKP